MTTVSQSFHLDRSPDSTFDSQYFAGDKPPGIEELNWDIDTALEDAGISTLQVGVTWSHDVRQYLSGTDAAVAEITVVGVGGDDPNGFSIEDAGDGDLLEFDGLADGAGTLRLRATGPSGSTDSAPKVWSCTDGAPEEDEADFLFPVSTITRNVNGDTLGILPGHIIEFAPGTHGRVNFINITGTLQDPVIVRNGSGGQVVFRSPTVMPNGFMSKIDNCEHMHIIGDNALSAPAHPLYGEPMGFKFMFATNAAVGNKDAFTSLLKYENGSSNILVSHFEMDGGYDPVVASSLSADVGIIGVQALDLLRTGNPGRFQDGNSFLHFYVRRCAGEGVYFGGNYAQDHIPSKNSEVGFFLVEDCGGDGLNLKNHWEGVNTVHDGIVRRCCLDEFPAGTPGSLSCIGCDLDVWNVIVEDCGNPDGPAGNGTGLKFFVQSGPPATAAPDAGYDNYPVLEVRAWNCVSRRNNNRGFSSGSQAGTATLRVKWFNCTAVDNEDRGLDASALSAAGGFIRNCISLGNSAQINAAGGTTQNNNLTVGTQALIFTDYVNDDFTLTEAQPAAGTLGVDIAAEDIDGNPRIAISADKGAYERA